MNNILEKLIGSLKNGDFIAFILIVIFSLIFNYKNIFYFLEERKKIRITKLTEAIKCSQIEGATKKHLEEELAAEHFKLSTGMHLEKKIREAILSAYSNTNGELSIAHFKRALPHIFYEDFKLKVILTRFDLVSFWFNRIFGIIMAIFGIIVLGVLTNTTGFSIFQVTSLLLYGLLFLTFSIFMIYQTFSVISAKKVAKHIKKNITQADTL